MVKDLDDGKKIIRGRSHSVSIENREKVTITGVIDVDSFDEASVIMVTDLGFITLHGADLHISKLNLEEGQLVVEGEIIALEYSEQNAMGGKGSGLFGRIFR
ncbi:MAG: sporulation protein YabP [Xylanivirga thermophila]|jgi:sporulation protein YabP|uniref:sporulation protein YabP n=1 Tax=Xylanivirga thermophila TaxID=2496273 RepID=UPI00101C1935|nr:sporulation protein YabP [Xylanivirga thermophila]